MFIISGMFFLVRDLCQEICDSDEELSVPGTSPAFSVSDWTAMRHPAFLSLILIACPFVSAQEAELAQPSTDPAAVPSAVEVDSSDVTPADGGQSSNESTLKDVSEQAKELASQTKDKVGEIAETLDKTEAAQNVSAGLLKPIYTLAETLSFPAFYWTAFALMVAGVVSYSFQLVLGKVVVLTKGSMNIREIMSDSVGLAICVIGLVLTTQAATENSTFAQTPSAVISATVAGAILGLCLYRWGQAEEIDAAMGRKKSKPESK